ncbi:glycine zipper 2TM domain-containing protein [Chromobacterium sp. Panama]|uniref:glycine zipper 2TM domain-containing protein n=1 Tax=Chromobacterium sp. Panama TaxID=2161826 RepID=UPI0018EE9532|nr:glycine zipper 2TM domain-containing protein [Chromobacterium sp. Panama]
MKQSLLIASVLGGGIALGGLGVAGYQAVKSNPQTAAAPQQTASAPPAASAAMAVLPPAVASAPAVVAAAAPVAAAQAAKPAEKTAEPSAPAKPAAPVHATHARILAVTPIKETVNAPKQVCHQEQVTHQAPVQDQNRIAGSVIGGVIGGVLGNQVGGGNGKKAATVIGALAGGLAGNKVQEGMQQRDQVNSTQTICNEVNESSEKVVGYDVKYSLDGKTGTVRMDRKPKGKTLPAKNGKVLV